MIKAFIGPAGSGKTHQLIEEVLARAGSLSWVDGQRILGLTFMHGSRARMEERFGQLRQNGYKAGAETIDSFSLDLVRRFRRSIQLNGFVQVDGEADGWVADGNLNLASFNTIRQSAVEILRLDAVQSTLRSTYPLIVIDEVQDCTGDLFEIVKLLSECCTVICAGDEFQHLEKQSDQSPIINWLKLGHETVELTGSRRTTSLPILGAAERLRTGQAEGASIPVVTVKVGALAAWAVASRIAFEGWRGSIAILSPVGPSRSKFVGTTLDSLSKELGKKKRIGPYPVSWEEPRDLRLGQALNEAWSPFEAIGQCTPAELRLHAMTHGSIELRPLYQSIRRHLMIAGVSSINKVEFSRMAGPALQRRQRWRGRDGLPGRRGMSIHSAKNREFDRVIILWPYEVSGDALYLRRLMYNAITRAKQDAVILVQDGKGDRVSKDGLLSLLVH